MTPANAVALSRALNQPSLTVRGGTAHGIPVITSGTVGARLIMLDASQILVGDTGALDVDISNNALVQLDSSPADPTIASTVLISLFQANRVGLRITRFMNWRRAQTTAVQDPRPPRYV